MGQQLTAIRTDVPEFDPDSEQVRIHFDAVEEGFATLIIFDESGSWVMSVGEVGIRAGANTLIWQGHDSEGWPLPSGQYRVELFGYGADRRPTGDEPLRLEIGLHHRRAGNALADDMPLRLHSAFQLPPAGPRAQGGGHSSRFLWEPAQAAGPA